MKLNIATREYILRVTCNTFLRDGGVALEVLCPLTDPRSWRLWMQRRTKCKARSVTRACCNGGFVLKACTRLGCVRLCSCTIQHTQTCNDILSRGTDMGLLGNKVDSTTCSTSTRQGYQAGVSAINFHVRQEHPPRQDLSNSGGGS